MDFKCTTFKIRDWTLQYCTWCGSHFLGFENERLVIDLKTQIDVWKDFYAVRIVKRHNHNRFQIKIEITLDNQYCPDARGVIHRENVKPLH